MTQAHHRSHLRPNMIATYVWVSNWCELHHQMLRHAKRGAIGLAVLFTMLNAGLFTVQNGKTSALTTINGKSYGLMPVDDVKQLLESEHAGALLTVKIGEQTHILNAEQSGVKLDADETLSTITDKKGWQRIPLVSAVGNLFAGVKPVYTTDHRALVNSLTPFIHEAIIPAKDASVTIPSNQNAAVTITPEESGSEFTAETAAEELAASVSAREFTMRLTAQELLPKWTELDMKAFMPAVEAARKTSMTITADKNEVTLSAEVLAPMLRIATDSQELHMTLDKEMLKNFLNGQSKVFYVAPIATKTTLKDGTEISRTEGKQGKRLDAAATAELATKAFENGIVSVTPALATLTPEELVTRTYSNTDMGLYTKIEDFAKSHSGTYRVAAVQLTGTGNRSAFYNADSKVITASTYKLFIAYGIMQKIDEGSLSLQSASSLGSVDYCMNQMIIVSSNECAKALQDITGWAAFDNKLKADGFTSTTLNNYSGGNKYSTARDEMLLVTRLYNRELLSASSTNYLFDLMKKQIYRKGVPAGSNGAVVADKVGFLDGLFHDIGIVYAPKGDYAVVILTDGAGGWTNVRALAEQIYDFYDQ